MRWPLAPGTGCMCPRSASMPTPTSWMLTSRRRCSHRCRLTSLTVRCTGRRRLRVSWSACACSSARWTTRAGPPRRPARPRRGRGAGVPAPALGCGSVLVRHSGVGHSVLVTHALVTFILAASLLVVLPGPDSLLVVRSIMLKGRRAAVTTTAGVLSGLAVWVAAAALGLAALLHASHVGYTALRIVGAVYLVTLGVQALRSAQRPAASVDRDRGPGVLGVGYRAGLVTNLLNPKIGVFFVTFLPGFVPAGAPVGPTSLLLGAVFVAEGALYFTVLILLAERLTGVLRRPVVRRRMDRLAGVVLIGFGARLLAES